MQCEHLSQTFLLYTNHSAAIQLNPPLSEVITDVLKSGRVSERYSLITGTPYLSLPFDATF